jgi:AcrR family transcriptional regulator
VGVAERKVRERAEREARIVEVARSIAEADGWAAVTIRRLATEIEYSQPVLYSHFANREAIVAAVALDGFARLNKALRAAKSEPNSEQSLGLNTALAYLAFAAQNPALYEAMFTLPTGLRFADALTPFEMKEAFALLNEAVGSSIDDDGTCAETFWAALHGLAELERSGRIRPGASRARAALIAEALSES